MCDHYRMRPRIEQALLVRGSRRRNAEFGISWIIPKSRVFEPGFSESRYGFRPGRSAHDAVLKAREYVAGGKRWVVDVDLEKFLPVWRSIALIDRKRHGHVARCQG